MIFTVTPVCYVKALQDLWKKYLWKFSIFKQKSVTYFDLVLFSGNEGLKVCVAITAGYV